ncbi:MAG: M1 family metallopeptidase [Burkholderiaceae bacterium]
MTAKRAGTGKGLPALLALFAFCAAHALEAGPGVQVAREIPFVSEHQAAPLTPSAPQAWGGPRTGSEAALSDRVVDYEIQAQLDPGHHTIDGKERVTWRNRSGEPVNALYLHLYLNAFEGPGSFYASERDLYGWVFRAGRGEKDGQWGHIEFRSASQGGKELSWSFVHPDGGPDTDHTVIRVDLATPVAPGGSTALDIQFFDQLPRVIARSGYFGSFHLVGQWFPKIGVLELPGERGATRPRWNVHAYHFNSEFYADFGSFDVRLTVPRGYTVGATGEEAGPATESAGMVTHHFVQNDVHDFAWTADNRTAKPLEGSFTSPSGSRVSIKVLFPPEYAASAEPALQAAVDSLAYFGKTLGAYPYRTLTLVIPPYNAEDAGGMEYPTFITVDHALTLVPGTDRADDFRFTVIHEFGHNYFYGMLASNEFEEPLLDEGLNEFWDHRMLRDRGEAQHLVPAWMKPLGIDPVVSPYDESRLYAQLDHPTDGLGQNSWDRLSDSSYGSVYSRGTIFMHDLEAQLGTPLFEDAMRSYFERWRFRHPSVADLRESLAEASGQRQLVERAFEEQVYHAGKVDDAVESLVCSEVLPEPGTRFVEGHWVEDTEEGVDAAIEKARADWAKNHPKQSGPSGAFPFRTIVTLGRHGLAVPETLVVHFEDGSEESVVWNDDALWQRYVWVKPVRALSATLDPKQTHLLDANRLNNSRLLRPSDRSDEGYFSSTFESVRRVVQDLLGGPAARRYSAEFESVLQIVLTLATTL